MVSRSFWPNLKNALGPQNYFPRPFARIRDFRAKIRASEIFWRYGLFCIKVTYSELFFNAESKSVRIETIGHVVFAQFAKIAKIMNFSHAADSDTFRVSVLIFSAPCRVWCPLSNAHKFMGVQQLLEFDFYFRPGGARNKSQIPKVVLPP